MSGTKIFGIVEAARRARAWGPHLETGGQRLVLSGIVFYTGADSTSYPTGTQLVAWSGLDRTHVSTVLTQLVDLGVIAPIGERSKGRKPTVWVVQPLAPVKGSTFGPGQQQPLDSRSQPLDSEAQPLAPANSIEKIEKIETSENGDSVASPLQGGSSVAFEEHRRKKKRKQTRLTEAEEQDALDAKKQEQKRLLADLAEAWSLPEDA